MLAEYKCGYFITKYPDSSQYVTVTNFVTELQYFINSYEDLWTLKQIKDVYDFNKKEVSLIIPCLLDAQADRRFATDKSSGLKLVCEFINSLNFKKVSVFHPHNFEVVEALLNNVELIYPTNQLSNAIRHVSVNGKSVINNLILMSTDGGGYKFLSKLADMVDWKGEIYGANKSRKYVDGKSTLVQQVDRLDFEGKDILIVDDLIVGGGTFVGLLDILRTRNVGKVYLMVSHITIQNPNERLNEFDAIFTTGTKWSSYPTLNNVIFDSIFFNENGWKDSLNKR